MEGGRLLSGGSLSDTPSLPPRLPTGFTVILRLNQASCLRPKRSRLSAAGRSVQLVQPICQVYTYIRLESTNCAVCGESVQATNPRRSVRSIPARQGSGQDRPLAPDPERAAVCGWQPFRNTQTHLLRRIRAWRQPAETGKAGAPGRSGKGRRLDGEYPPCSPACHVVSAFKRRKLPHAAAPWPQKEAWPPTPLVEGQRSPIRPLPPYGEPGEIREDVRGRSRSGRISDKDKYASRAIRRQAAESRHLKSYRRRYRHAICSLTQGEGQEWRARDFKRRCGCTGDGIRRPDGKRGRRSWTSSAP